MTDKTQDLREIVINNCYGGYGLSEEAGMALAKRKGITVYAEPGLLRTTAYWTVPKEERVPDLNADWYKLSMEERRAHNAKHDEQVFYPTCYERDDADLIAVVKELGSDRASGYFASLKIVAIPADVSWGIHDYDGMEHVEETHRTWG